MSDQPNTDGPKKQHHWEIWIILASVLGVLLLLAVGPAVERVQIAIISKGLKAQDSAVREKAIADLLARGTAGRLALLRDLASSDTQSDLRHRLVADLRKEIEAGRDVRPIVQAAADALHRGGGGAAGYAHIAAEGWPLGLLDDRTKNEIVRQFLHLELVARQEYPLGKGAPYVSASWNTEHSTVLRFSAQTTAIADGQPGEQSGKGEVGAQENCWTGIGCTFRKITGKLGRHTLKGKVDVALTDIVTNGKFRAVEQPGWKTTVETPEAAILVRDDLPAGFLEAKVTPELEKAMTQAVKTQPVPNSDFCYGMKGKYITVKGSQQFTFDRPLPVDLACGKRWIEVETGREVKDYGLTLLSGTSNSNSSLFPPEEAAADLPPGEHTLTFRLILEPSFDQALNDPAVKAYWPRPVELPPITYKFQVKKTGD